MAYVLIDVAKIIVNYENDSFKENIFVLTVKKHFVAVMFSVNNI